MEQVLDGDDVVIARAGKALVRLVPVEDHPPKQRQLGFLKGSAVMDCDLKTDFQDDIAAMFR